MDLVQEALIIVNAAVKGSTYPYLGCTFPYTGICGTVYGRTYTVFFRNDNCNDSSVLWTINCKEGTEIY